MSIKLFKVDYRVPDDENKLARHGKSQSLKKQPKCINFVCVCVCIKCMEHNHFSPIILFTAVYKLYHQNGGYVVSMNFIKSISRYISYQF